MQTFFLSHRILLAIEDQRWSMGGICRFCFLILCFILLGVVLHRINLVKEMIKRLSY